MADNEYRASDGVIRVEGDELVFAKGGRVNRKVFGADTFRIPIACIREVVFKKPGATRGVMHLVIGDAPAPQAGLWATTGLPWTLTFQPGSASKQFTELHAWLQSCLEHNRANGVDPLTARLPYPDESAQEDFDVAKQQALGDSLVWQPTPDAPLDEVVKLAKRKPKAYSSLWTDLDSLPDRLAPGESVRLLAVGMVGLSATLVALTDRRVVFHCEGPSSRKHDELPLPVRASWNSNIVTGGPTLGADQHEVVVRGLSDENAQTFVAALVATTPMPPPDDVLGQLERLSELHRAGVLTDAEFDAKKTDLLGRL